LINCAIKELTASIAVFVLNKKNFVFHLINFFIYQYFAALSNLSSCFLFSSGDGKK